MDLLNFIPTLGGMGNTSSNSLMTMDGGYKPRLVEPGIESYVKGTLKQCKQFKNQYSNVMYNIIMFSVFVGVFGIILFVKFKGKMTKGEKRKRDRDKQHYILSKLQQMNAIRSKPNGRMITDLPNWNDHPEKDILNRFR